MSSLPASPHTPLSDNQRFHLFVTRVRDYAIYMLDPNGYVSSWNVGAQRFKGYQAEEIIGRHFSCFYTPEDQAAGVPARALRTALDEGKFEAEGWRMRKDGTRFWASVVIDPIRDDSGELIGFAKVTRDITEKRAAAEALEKANAALHQAQKMEALGQLTGGVAHDFNNILAVLTSGLDLLAEHVKDHGAIKVVEGMHRAVQRGATLTQQLLSFARQQPLKVEKHNLNNVINGFESMLRRAINSTISFEMKLDPALHTVLVDAPRFETSLLNLIVNARDAMPNGGSLIIGTENVILKAGDVSTLAAGSYVKVSVTDTGCGMSPDVVARAFEPFYTTKGVGKGTGLGLSQVYGFMVQSGGHVLMQSEIGKGTTVSLYLPALAEIADERQSGIKVEKVLVVEDEPDVLTVAAELFRSIGYEVVTACNGVDALEVLKRHPDIDILFSDVIMPQGMSGIELGRRTRELYPKIKVILASGYALPALKAEYGTLDDVIFMNKPYRLSELAKTLRMA